MGEISSFGVIGKANGAAEFVVRELRIYRITVGKPFEVKYETAARMKDNGVDVRGLIDEGVLKVAHTS